LIPSVPVPPTTPGPLGLLGVGPKHKLFVFCPHYWGAWYPDLQALQICTGPTSVGRFLTFIKNLWFWFFKNILEWFEFRQKLETQVWFGS